MIVGILGARGSGKSTVAEFLARDVEANFVELSFASILKEIIATLFFLSKEQLNDCVLKEKIIPDLGVSPRYLMQNIGTELFRNHLYKCLPDLRLGKDNQNIWVWHMKIKIQHLLELNPKLNIVVSDVRFEDEFDLLKNEFKATMIFIERPEIHDDGASKVSQHISESFCFLKTEEGHEKLDHVIVNDNSLEYLHHLVNAFIIK